MNLDLNFKLGLDQDLNEGCLGWLATSRLGGLDGLAGLAGLAWLAGLAGLAGWAGCLGWPGFKYDQGC